MSKFKLLTIAVIGLLVINLGMVGYLMFKKTPPRDKMERMGSEGRPGMKPQGPKMMIIDRLQFDKEQVDEFEKLIETHQATIKNLNDSIKVAKNNLYRSLNSETFADRDGLANKLGALQKQIELTHFEHFAAIKKLCKPEQLADFNKLTNDLANFFTQDRKSPPPPPRKGER